MAYEPPHNDAVDFTAESYTPPANDAVDFTVGEETAPFRVTNDRLNLPLSLDLPMSSVNLSNMQTGVALFIVGMLGVLGLATAWLRNYVAASVLGLAVIALILSGTIGTALTPFWMLLVAAVFVLIAGALLRGMNTA